MTQAVSVADKVVLLLSLIPFLRNSGPVTVAELAQRFSISEKTVRELVTFLGTAGIPGETHTYQPEDLFDIDWDAFERHDTVSLTHIVAVDQTPRFAPAEHSALLAGLHTLSEIMSEPHSSIALSAARKLALASPEEGIGHSEVGESAAPVLTVSARTDPRFQIISKAMAENSRLQFEYVDFGGNLTRREIDPESLTEQGGDWYLRGYCLSRGDDRTFLVASMSNLEIAGQMTVNRKNTAPDRAHSADSFSNDTQVTMVKARVKEHVLHRLAGFRPRIIERAENQWVRIEVDLAFQKTAIRLVQASPGDVVIEEPAEARESVREWVDRAFAHANRHEAGGTDARG